MFTKVIHRYYIDIVLIIIYNTNITNKLKLMQSKTMFKRGWKWYSKNKQPKLSQLQIQASLLSIQLNTLDKLIKKTW